MSTVVLITGVSGTGKTALARHLTARGEHAISLDAHPGLCRWEDPTGRPVVRPEQPDIGWLRRHHWNWRPAVLDMLIGQLRSADLDRVFVYGTAANMALLTDRFDLIFALDVDLEIMLARLRHPERGNDFGRAGAGRQLLAERFATDRAATSRLAHVVINATDPLTVVANAIRGYTAICQLQPVAA
jgi:thymidylate kinase